jgi:hypothetical protein
LPDSRRPFLHDIADFCVDQLVPEIEVVPFTPELDVREVAQVPEKVSSADTSAPAITAVVTDDMTTTSIIPSVAPATADVT